MVKTALTLPLFGLLSGASLQPPPEPVPFETGMWETGVEVAAIEAPTLPPAVRQSLVAMFESLRDRQCSGGLSTNPLEDFKAGIVAGFSGGRCEFEEDRIGDGSFSSRSVCRRSGSVVTNIVQGAYTPSEFAGDFTIIVQRPADTDGEPFARVRGRVTSRVTGPCPDPSV